MAYSTHVTIDTSYGKYDWCGKMHEGYKPGFYLCSYYENRVGKPAPNVMVSIKIKLDKNLHDVIDIIEMYDCTGFLAQYTVGPINFPVHHFFFSLQYCEPGTDLKILYRKILPRPEKYTTLRRSPMKTIYEETIKIPEIVVKDTVNCGLCSNHVDTNFNKYISKCSHLFHMDCLWKHLDPEYDNNQASCKKIAPFPCPLCSTQLEDNYN